MLVQSDAFTKHNHCGQESEGGWGADRVPDKDPRLKLGPAKLPLSPRNANTLWMLHFLHHLKPGGAAGFVMADRRAGQLRDGPTGGPYSASGR